MSAFQKVLAAFSSIGIPEYAVLTQNEVFAALQNLCRRNAQHLGSYEPHVAHELWEQASKESNNKVSIKNFVEVILRAESIVSIEIQALDDEIKQEKNEYKKNESIQELMIFMEDHKFLTQPFGWSPGLQTKNITSSSYYMSNSKPINSAKLRASKKSLSSDSTVIFAKNHTHKGRGTSRDLIAAILITIICSLMEGFIMFDKHHFYNMMLYFSIVSIFLFNYFDKYYMGFVLIFIGVSLLMDSSWLIVETKQYWDPNFESEHSVLEIAYAEFMVVLVMIELLLKIIIGLILLKYRSNPQTISKNVRLFGANFPLDGFHNSPVAFLLGKNVSSTYDY